MHESQCEPDRAVSDQITQLPLTICVGIDLNIGSIFPNEINYHKLERISENKSKELNFRFQKDTSVNEKDPITAEETAQTQRSTTHTDWTKPYVVQSNLGLVFVGIYDWPYKCQSKYVAPLFYSLYITYVLAYMFNF